MRVSKLILRCRVSGSETRRRERREKEGPGRLDVGKMAIERRSASKGREKRGDGYEEARGER